MSMENRGGYPNVLRDTILSTGDAYYHFWRFISKYVKARSASFPVKMYFTAEDAAADTNYIIIPAATAGTTETNWEGPLEVNQVWLKAIGGSTLIEFVAFQRRG